MLGKAGIARQGCRLTEEQARQVVQERYPDKPFCIVRDWKLINLDVSADELAEITVAGLLPQLIYSGNVRFDSQNRFDPGNWVRSTAGLSYHEDGFFETRNTVYVLLGDGFEQTQPLKIAMSIF